jgi:hypothetical protein
MHISIDLMGWSGFLQKDEARHARGGDWGPEERTSENGCGDYRF